MVEGGREGERRGREVAGGETGMTATDVSSCSWEDLRRGPHTNRLHRGQSAERTANKPRWELSGTGLVTDLFNSLPLPHLLMATLRCAFWFLFLCVRVCFLKKKSLLRVGFYFPFLALLSFMICGQRHINIQILWLLHFILSA